MSDVISSATAEQSEAEALFDFEVGAPEHVRAMLGIEAVRIGGGVVLSVRRDPTRFWSKALGFGHTTPVTAELIDEVCAFYRSRKTPTAVFQLAPSVLPEDWADIRTAAGLTAGPSWAKLVCDTDEALRLCAEPGRPAARVRVARVVAQDAPAWASVMMQVFGMPGEGLAGMAASSVGREGWHPFGAWDGEQLVGTGTMRLHQDVAQLFGAATLPHARNRGAQSAILAARARAAKSAGCRWLVAETGAETPGTHNTSLRNMQKVGFRVLYERQSWIWRSGEDS